MENPSTKWTYGFVSSDDYAEAERLAQRWLADSRSKKPDSNLVVEYLHNPGSPSGTHQWYLTEDVAASTPSELSLTVEGETA